MFLAFLAGEPLRLSLPKLDVAGSNPVSRSIRFNHLGDSGGYRRPTASLYCQPKARHRLCQQLAEAPLARRGALPDELTARRLLPERNQSVAKADLDYIEAVYDEEIADTDMWIGRLWEALDSNYGADRNVFVFTADHGEYFLERGRFFHGKDTYDALVHVPLLIAGAIEPELRGTTVAGSVETRSIAATVMGLLGMRDHAFGGQDLLEVARGASAEPAFTEGSHAFATDERKLAVVHDGWKLIHHLDTGRYELYEFASDPGERSDRWEAESESEDGIVASFEATARRFRGVTALGAAADGDLAGGARAAQESRLRSLR